MLTRICTRRFASSASKRPRPRASDSSSIRAVISAVRAMNWSTDETIADNLMKARNMGPEALDEAFRLIARSRKAA